MGRKWERDSQPVRSFVKKLRHRLGDDARNPRYLFSQSRVGDLDPLTYSLTGEGADKFTVSTVDGGVQLAVAADAIVDDYDVVRSYTLTLSMSDGRDDYNNVDNSVDGETLVRVNVEPDPDGKMKVALIPDRTTQTLGQPVVFAVALGNLPVPPSEQTY